MLKPLKGQIFFYCEDDIECYQVRCIHEVKRDSTKFDITRLDDMTAHFTIIPNDYVTASFEVGESVVRLDDTTMKRIAKYNLCKEFESLNKKIELAKEEINSLDKEMMEKKRKLDAMDKLVEMIWNDMDFEEDNYFPKDDDWGYDDD